MHDARYTMPLSIGTVCMLYPLFFYPNAFLLCRSYYLPIYLSTHLRTYPGIFAFFALAGLSYPVFKLCGGGRYGYGYGVGYGGNNRNRVVVDNGLVRRGSMTPRRLSIPIGRMNRRPSGKYCGNGGIVEMANTSANNLYSDNDSNDNDNHEVTVSFFGGKGEPYIDDDDDDGDNDDNDDDRLKNVML